MFTVYILWSETTGKFYTGHTHDLADRLKRHQEGRSSATKPGIPWTLVHSERFNTKSEAVRRELEIKSWKSAERIRELCE